MTPAPPNLANDHHESGGSGSARKLNMARRHLNQEQRRGLIQAELKDRPEVSDRQIAKALGVSNKTVSTARNELVENGELCNLHSSIGADGKERPRQVERKTPEPELPIASPNHAPMQPDTAATPVFSRPLPSYPPPAIGQRSKRRALLQTIRFNPGCAATRLL